MHYESKDLGFSFDLPSGWKKDEHKVKLTFYGPNGGPGTGTETIQVEFGTINHRYEAPASRERYLAEPGAQVFRSRVGDEDNVVVLKRKSHSEISVVRDGIHYTISHANDAPTESAIERLRKTAQFPGPELAQASIDRSADPAYQAAAQMIEGKAPAPHPRPSTDTRIQEPKGCFGRFLAFFKAEPAVHNCETCAHQMQVLGFSGSGSVLISPQDAVSGVGHAEQCWECGRLYCSECYPSRPPNTCVCGRGRNATRQIGGTTYRGSLRLMKVRYIS